MQGPKGALLKRAPVQAQLGQGSHGAQLKRQENQALNADALATANAAVDAERSKMAHSPAMAAAQLASKAKAKRG